MFMPMIMPPMIMVVIMLMSWLGGAWDAISSQRNYSRLDARKHFNRHLCVATRNFPRLRLLGIPAQRNKDLPIGNNNPANDTR
jgi:hypothetical protein